MKTKQFPLALCAILAAAALVFAASCGNRSNRQSTLTVSGPLTENLTGYPLPTAYEVTNLINRSGAAFVIGITNPVENVERYLTEKSKAVNLGIYGADLAYVTTYNMQQETMDYLRVLRQLSDELNVTTNFNVDLAREVERHIDNKDTLISIISQAFHDTYSFLVNNGKDDISVLVLAGTWIEGLYLTSMVATTSMHPVDLLQIVANQRESLSTLVSLLEQHSEGSADVAKMRQLLEPIVLLYSKVGDTVSEAQAIQISDTVEQIRNQLVK